MNKLIMEQLEKLDRDQAWLSRQLEISQPALSYRMNSDYVWPFDEFIKLLDIFQLTNDQIIEYISKEQGK